MGRSRAVVDVNGLPINWASHPVRLTKRNRKDPICFSPYLCRARNLVERFFNKIKQCRRVATRYDKLAANYLASIKLTSILIWLRANESAPQPNANREPEQFRFQINRRGNLNKGLSGLRLPGGALWRRFTSTQVHTTAAPSSGTPVRRV
jgi:hypothetical protein